MKYDYQKNRDNWMIFSANKQKSDEEKRWNRIRKNEMEEEWYFTYLEDEYGINIENDFFDEYLTYYDEYEGE